MIKILSSFNISSTEISLTTITLIVKKYGVGKRIFTAYKKFLGEKVLSLYSCFYYVIEKSLRCKFLSINFKAGFSSFFEVFICPWHLKMLKIFAFDLKIQILTLWRWLVDSVSILFWKGESWLEKICVM